MLRLLDPLVSLVFPEFCHVCGELVESTSDGVACRACWERVRFLTVDSPLCGKCGRFLIDGRPGAVARCGQCNDHFYDQARSAGLYEFALLATVLSLKNVPWVPSTAAKALEWAIPLLPVGPDHIVMPVPLSKKRLAERGFDQAAILARLVSRKARLPLDEFSLIRVRDTQMHRTAMDRKAREASVKGAFAVTRPALIKDRHILLVDDVMTTGASASHCAFSLKKNGAASVNVLTLARAVG
ncbi:MAG: double zinc ribbon domain-containing protein [Pyrinomonadaceae bacterium]